MSILGVIVRARPSLADDVQQTLRVMPGLSIAGHDNGRFVVVIEDTPDSGAAQVMTHITQLADVLNTSLVYEYSGPDAPARADEVNDFQSWRGRLSAPAVTPHS